MRQFGKIVKKALENHGEYDYLCSTPPTPDQKAGTLETLRAAGIRMDSVDKHISSGYFYPIQKRLDVKKAGHVDPLSLDTDGWNRHCFRCVQTAPGISWAIMEAIKPYRRFSPRRLFYILCTTLPAQLLQPVISCGRDPPAT